LPQNGQNAASSAWKPPRWMQYGTRRISNRCGCRP
jgi:hypothetical protein